ncbi:MAG: hypothetical protein WAR37_02695 [Candidatus Microsaccharimonas sp.]
MEIVRFPSHGGFSVRSIFTFALAVIMTALLMIIVSSTPTHAADAAWNGANIDYDNKQFYLAGTTRENEIPGIPADSRYYLEAVQPQVTPGSSTAKVNVIYLKPGTDPPGDGTATFANYNYNPTTKVYTSPSNVTSISVDTDSINRQITTCSIPGVGWIVCPIMNFLAWGMDTVFTIIADFMEVQPLQLNNPDNALYSAWNIIRGIANIAFVIVFLIIIYAQLTGLGINNYSLKRLLPRLIIAAIGVNLSFIIVAIGVDLSNILGWSINDMFVSLRNTLFSTSALNSQNMASLLSWESITGFVLSGGTAVGAGTIGAIAIAGSTSAAIFLLLPALLGLLIGILVVLLILAARQALIVILAIIAPLAIVAYLLPNTEKWFKKWRDLLMTMLIFFPAFAVVFGGSQLAGAIIIQNADSLNMLILGMIVQVAPLVLTPLLLKLSGSVLGGIARLVNDPNRGIIDRTRKWSGERADWHVKRAKANLDRRGNPRLGADGKPKNFRPGVARASRYFDQKSRRLKDRIANADSALQTDYEESKRHTAYDKNGNLKYDMSQQKAYFEARKEATHSHHAAHVDEARRTQGSMLYGVSMNAETQKEKAEISKNATAAYYNAIRADNSLATRVGGSALHTSSYNLEVSKKRLEGSENVKAAFYETQSAITGTTLSQAAVRVQSSKEHLESAQSQLQAYFDRQRTTVGTELNTSTIRLEGSKSVAEQAKADLTTYVSLERSEQGGVLREVTVNMERSKQNQQIAETKLTSFIDEMQTGKIDPANLSAYEQSVSADMQQNAIRLAAEKRRGDSARYEIQSRFADVMTGVNDSPIEVALTEEMRTIAQGVGGDTARVRAIANAVATARGLDNDALKANVDLLKDEGKRKGMSIKYYSNEIVEAVLAGQSVMPDGTNLTPERIKAALQAQAEERNIPLFEKVGGSTNFDQAMVREIISLNSPAFKGAGAFAMQDKLTTIADFVDDFNDPVKVAQGKEAYEYQLSLDHISNLASANATGIAEWKMGEVIKVAKELEQDIKASLEQIARGSAPGATDKDRDAADESRRNLKAAYKTVRDALLNDDIVATMNDREEFVRTIEAELARIHGQEPTPSKDFDLEVDIHSYDPSRRVREASETLPENTEDTDDNGNTPTPS